MAALLIGVGVAAASSAGAGVSSYHNLTGHWTTEGTSLTLKQSGRVITWTGRPDNRAWIQTFKGTISEDRYGPYQRRFVNNGKEAIQVKIYDELHSQERFVVTVLPRKR